MYAPFVDTQKTHNGLGLLSGGSQEAFRKKETEKYSLNWGKRDGFARYAIRHGYTIVPVSAVGIEDSFKILYDMPTDAFFRLIKDVRPPLTAPFFVPSGYERQYFKIHDPIDTEGMELTDENVSKIRELTKEVIETGIADLKEVRKKDPDRYVIPSLIRWVKNMFS